MKLKNTEWIAATLLAALGCGDDQAGTGAGGGGPASSSSSVSVTASSSASGQGGEGGEGGAGGQTPTVEVLASFDAEQLELPEGLAIHDDQLLLGFAFSSTVDTFDLGGGSRAPFAAFPIPAPNTGFFTGVTTDADGAVYGALVSFSPDPVAGEYRAATAGGIPELFASHAQMVFPNGFVWDDAGTLFVTDSATSTVFSVAADGTVAPWISDPLLAGDPLACGGQPDDIAVGANGVVWTEGALFVASSDQGLVARIPIESNGSAGAIEVLAGPDCSMLAGIDGLALDEDGTLVGAVNRTDRLVRIEADGTVTVLLEGAPLDFPASLVFEGSGDDRALYVTSFALARALAGEPASPALVRVRF